MGGRRVNERRHDVLRMRSLPHRVGGGSLLHKIALDGTGSPGPNSHVSHPSLNSRMAITNPPFHSQLRHFNPATRPLQQAPRLTRARDSGDNPYTASAVPHLGLEHRGSDTSVQLTPRTSDTVFSTLPLLFLSRAVVKVLVNPPAAATTERKSTEKKETEKEKKKNRR